MKMQQELITPLDIAVKVISHCVSQLEFCTTFLPRNARLVLPQAAFATFWEDVLALDIEEVGVTYRFPEPGIVRVFLHFKETYELEYRVDGSLEYMVDCLYVGILHVDGHLDQDLLERCAAIVLTQMKNSAQEFVQLSKASSA